uniref:Ig-like domain-containing protein n=1 Tax=Salarias fasciatus TaxID=181472 RepID=A0A672FCH5_SALFA
MLAGAPPHSENCPVQGAFPCGVCMLSLCMCGFCMRTPALPVSFVFYVFPGAVLKIDPGWSTLFIGEFVTLTCDIEGAEAGWEYSFYKDQQQYSPGYQTTNSYRFQITSSNDGGEYDCVGRHKGSSETEKSKTVSFTAAEKPRATLTSGNTTISVGGSVSLSCSVRDSDGWKYEFYKTTSTSWEKLVETSVGDSGVIQVSKGGIYQCRGERETSGYLSDMSDVAIIRITFTNKPVITQQPSWSQIFQGEKITLTCEVQGGEKTDWRYYWRRNSRSLPNEDEKLLQFTASESFNGDYKCMTTRRDDFYSLTTWSEAFTVSVLRPKLSVSPSWLIPGASVTLICHTEPPSAGWSFYWFKAVPNSQDSYTYEPLPGTSSGTANNSFTVHGQTHTAGYACSAGRGDPLIYTQHSRPTFVWSSGVHPSASLTVNPDRVQHFTSESLSLTCEGSSSQWRLIQFLTDDSLLSFLPPATINGSTYIKNEAPRKAVYWCESGTEFSNAVNISTHCELSFSLLIGSFEAFFTFIDLKI